MAKRASGLSQQLAADAVGISLRSAQRIDRGVLQPEGQQQRRGRHWRTRASCLVPDFQSALGVTSLLVPGKSKEEDP